MPLVVHTLRAFTALAHMGKGVLVVAPEDNHMAQVLGEYPQARFEISRTGGATRAQSVLSGLRALQQSGVSDDDWVMVHDAARCLITPELIQKLWDSCHTDAVGGLLALPLPDTLKSGQGDRVLATLPRNDKWLAQTPQMFHLSELMHALQMAGDQVTDEASAFEMIGRCAKLVEAASFNFKVTYAQDIPLAQAVLASRGAVGNTTGN
jgi:2-C-methyl-D-erythritol 4-phosphate cytidylyltransferase